MRVKCCLLIACVLLLTLPLTASAEPLFYFPCDNENFALLGLNGHTISRGLNLQAFHCAETGNWEDDNLMVESGSAMILDDQFLIVDLHFSDTFDDEANHTHVPGWITFVHYDADFNDPKIPKWKVTVYPEPDDPYAFHYIGTCNCPMVWFMIYGSYVNSEGEPCDCFSLQVPLYYLNR